MKAALIGAAALGLANVAFAQPHRIRHVHPARRGETVEVVTDYITVEREEIVVYLDDQGNAVATSTFWTDLTPSTASPESSSTTVPAEFLQVQSSPAPAPPPPSPAPEAPAAASPAPAPESPAPAPSPAPSASPAPAPSSPPANDPPASGPPASGPPSGGSGSSPAPGPSNAGSGFGYGLAYSPYQANHDCKNVDQIRNDLNKVSAGYQVIRLYGTDCNQVANVIDATQGKGLQLISGVFDIHNWQAEVQTIIDAVKNHAGGNWGVIHTVNIGNEDVNNGQADVNTVVAATNGARDMLRGAGFQGSVVHVDTMVAHKNNPQLCAASDYCAINCHAFFDPNTAPQDAGSFVKGWVEQIAAQAGGKPVIVTETGYPSAGDAHGKAVPSPDNQRAAISSIRNALSNNVVLFTALDDKWKSDNAGTFGAEQHWGIYGQ